MFFKKDKKNRTKKGGFTLVELMVVLVIFVALTGVVMSSQSRFDGTILLNNLAYDIALSVRQAQNYGVNVKESSLNNSSSTFSGYGVVFDTSDNKHYILFADVIGNNGNGNNYFDSTDFFCSKSDPECIEKYALTRGSYIKSLCVANKEEYCTGTENLTNRLTVTFKRPNPDAHITKGVTGNMLSEQSFAKIVISSAGGQTKSIIVTALGQIYVK